MADDGLRIGSTYSDKRGRLWTVTSFLTDGGPWFIDDPFGAHVHVMRARTDGKRYGRFVKRSTFVKSLATNPKPSVGSR
jgi:hypothetical protein